MKKVEEVKNVSDVKIGKSDFIFEHKKVKFQTMYKVDADKILGSGTTDIP